MPAAGELRVSDMPGLNARAIALLGAPGSGKTETLAAFFDASGVRVLGIDPAGQLGQVLGRRSDVDVVTLPKDWQQRPGLFAGVIKRLKPADAKLCLVIPPTAYGTAGDFVEALCVALMEANITDLLLIMEECQRYLGQNREGLSYGALATVEMGRNWRWGRVMATQRPAELHKGGLGRADTAFLGRMDKPRDLEAFADILEPYIQDPAQRRAVVAEFKDFAPGHFIVVQPKHIPTVNQ